MMASYKVNIGLNYPTKSGEKRGNPGDIISDLPTKSVDWLLREGVIELVEPAMPPKDGE
jgi:hypothetical protein